MKEREEKPSETERKPKSIYSPVLCVLMLAAIAVLAMNQIAIANIGTSVRQMQANKAAESPLSQLPDVTPKGIPLIYGTELGVSYDDISLNNQQKADATIKKLALQDVNIKLSEEQNRRYVEIAGRISCEYCCGTPSVIFTKDSSQYKAGDAACGCAHSYAMRGVAKYIITKHGSEFTDDQILEEMGKWKTLFFPGQIAQKAEILKQRGIELNYINMASNAYRDIEKEAGSGVSSAMVGGC